MSKRRIDSVNTSALLAAALGALVMAGCGAAEEEREESPEAAEIASQLELENGGLSMEDEMASFDDVQVSGAVDPETPVDDALASQEPLFGLAQKPDAVKYELMVAWGQIP